MHLICVKMCVTKRQLVRTKTKRHCMVCAKPFYASRWDARLCSIACRLRASRFARRIHGANLVYTHTWDHLYRPFLPECTCKWCDKLARYRNSPLWFTAFLRRNFY